VICTEGTATPVLDASASESNADQQHAHASHNGRENTTKLSAGHERKGNLQERTEAAGAKEGAIGLWLKGQAMATLHLPHSCIMCAKYNEK